MKHPILTCMALAAIVLPVLSCKKSAPANAAAIVNNRTITYTELEKAYQSQFAPATEGASEDQASMQKLELVRTLIDAEIMLQRAEKLGLLAGDADVEARLSEIRALATREEFDRQLQERKMTVDDLKAQLRRELSIQKVVNKEITSRISITDADVANFYNANKASFNLAEPQVHLAQILVTPFPDPNARNLKNSKAQNVQEAKNKILDLQGRLKRGEDFAMLAQNYSEDGNSAANGGDMGFIPASALEKANPQLRATVMGLQPGGFSEILTTPQGFRILKVISKEPAGQRELNDPRVQQSIRETLMNRKDQLLKSAYYEMARNGAKVVNYYAERIVKAGK